jgi:hypothetical protein
MYLLKRHGDHYQCTDFYADAFLKAFPKLIDEVAGKVKPSPDISWRDLRKGIAQRPKC